LYFSENFDRSHLGNQMLYAKLISSTEDIDGAAVAVQLVIT